MELRRQIPLTMFLHLTLFASFATSEPLRVTTYGRCPAGQISNGQQLDNVIGRSVLGCAARCSRLTGCVGINVCPGGFSGQVTCALIGQHSSVGCDNLSSGIASVCFFMQKQTTELEATTVPETTAIAQTTELETTTVPETTTATAQTTELETTTVPKTTTAIAQTTELETTTVPETTTAIAQTTELETTTVPETTTAIAQTTELECQNGGTLDLFVGGCQCTPQYSGTKCERLIRDCTEIFENGYKTTAYNGVYDIRPASAPTSFKVRCDFGQGYPFTYALRRKSFVYNPDWETAKTPAGDDLSANPASRNFFVGLENLHHLVTQASYTNIIFMKPASGSWGWTNYHNFSIGPATSDYALTYDKFTFYPSYPADNGFPVTSLPVTFNTFDHGNCYYVNGDTTGWYGTDCRGYSFFASDLKWPIGGVPKSLDWIEFDIVRDSPFYD